MKRIVRNLFEAVYFLICFAPIPLIAGYALMQDGLALLFLTAFVIPVAYILSLLPSHVGGRKKKQEIFVERARTHGDPDPDRNLRRDTHEEQAKSVRFPLRAVVGGLAMLGVALVLILAPIPAMHGLDWFKRGIVSLIPALLLPLALRFCVLGMSTDTRNAAVGLVLYLLAGVIAVFIRSDTLNQFLSVGGSVFLIASLWMINDQAMHTGAASRSGVKPPAVMRRRNRVLLVVMLLLVGLIAGFNWLKEKVSLAAVAVLRALWDGLLFLSNLFGSKDMAPGGMGTGEQDLGDMFGGGAETTSMFWEILTYVAYVVAAVLLVLLVILAVRRIARLLKAAFAALSAYFKRFAQSVGEDYQDEQESLMDWGEIQKELGESFKARMERLFKRDKKWDQMDERERARHIVRVLYRRSAVKADSRTLREVLPALKAEQPELLAAAYEQARYAEQAPDGALLERLRRDEHI